LNLPLFVYFLPLTVSLKDFWQHISSSAGLCPLQLMCFTLCIHVLRSSSFSLNMLLNLSRVGVWGKQLILQLYYSLFCEKIQAEKLFGKQLHPTFKVLIPNALFCSDENKLKKLGELMNESHYSCSVLYECRYKCLKYIFKNLSVQWLWWTELS
jgi:hypothetical protein